MVGQYLKFGCVSRLLGILDDTDIPYVSWKNNHELEKALSGKSDIDLFVPLEFRDAFFRLCRQEGWLVAENPIAQYPWVNHFYKPDSELTINHLHVYFKVVTGESWLKEYILPLDGWLIDNRIRCLEFGIWILNNQAQAYLFTVRHLLKCGSLLGRLLYFKELPSYREEWSKCAYDLKSTTCEDPFDLKLYGAGTNLKQDGLKLPCIRTAIGFRTSLHPFLRVSALSLPFRRLGSFFGRVQNKLIYRKKKIFLNGGLAIAISGVDGAGKSTMLKEANDFCSGFLTVEQYHIGKPQGILLETFRTLINPAKNREHKLQWSSRTSGISIKKAVSATIIALLRLKLARKIEKRASKGYLILVDRWPTRIVGKMDGPKIFFQPNEGLLVQWLRKFESWAYAQMPMVDVCFYFELPLFTAVERNRNRVKKMKEMDEEITTRYKNNVDFSPLSRKTVIFNNAGDLAPKRKEFILKLWSEIIRHQYS